MEGGMFENVVKMFKGERDPLKRARLLRGSLQSQREALAAEDAAVKRQSTAAAQAAIDGKSNAEDLAKAAEVRRLAFEQSRRELDSMLETVDREIASLEERSAAEDVKARQQRAVAKMRQRETLAPTLQSLVVAVARTYAEMEELRVQATGLLPDSRERCQRLPEQWRADFALLAAIEQQLMLASGFQLGDPRAKGIYSDVELRQRAIDIPATVALSHRQFAGDLMPEPEPEAA